MTADASTATTKEIRCARIAGCLTSSASRREAEPVGRVHDLLLDGRRFLEDHPAARIPEPVAANEPDDRPAALGAQPEQVDLDVEVLDLGEVPAEPVGGAVVRDLAEVAQRLEVARAPRGGIALEQPADVVLSRWSRR